MYALGCLLFAMLTGRPPFTQERGLLQVMYQQVHEMPVAPSTLRPEVFPELDRLVLDLLAKSPDARPPTAASVVDRLRRLSLPTVEEPPPASTTYAPGPDGTDDEDESESEDAGFFDDVRADLYERHRAARGLDDPDEARAALAPLAAHVVQLLGADDPLALEIRFDLACTTARTGQVADAARLLAALLPALVAAHGPVDRRVLYARCLLAWFTAEAGALDEANALYAAVVPDLRVALGETHTMTLHTRFQQLVQLRASGDAISAVRGWIRLLPLLGADPAAASTARDARAELAACILDAAGTGNAAARERAAQVLRVLVPEVVPLLDTASESAYAARAVLVRWIAEAGTARESLPAWRVLIADAGQALGELHPLTLRARLALAEHTVDAGDTEEAHALLCALVPALAAGLGADAEPVLRCRFLIAGTAPEPDWQQVVPDLERVLGSGHPLTVDGRFRQALSAVERGGTDLDVAPLRLAIEQRTRLFPADDPLTLRGRFVLADGTERAGRRAEARRLWQELVPDLTQAMGPRHELTQAVRGRLGIVDPEPQSPLGAG
ncbi:hypothetical protein ACIBUY_20650 [Streptomyces sp. NPDC050085]|uniref:hypothetical protein n=1 Tax=Streptomyces sp. NPDC050085 TaxID=3365600 RepID=UPI0037A93FC7